MTPSSTARFFTLCRSYISYHGSCAEIIKCISPVATGVWLIACTATSAPDGCFQVSNRAALLIHQMVVDPSTAKGKLSTGAIPLYPYLFTWADFGLMERPAELAQLSVYSVPAFNVSELVPPSWTRPPP